MLYLYTVLKAMGYFVLVIKSMKYNLTYLWVHDLLSFTTNHAVEFFSIRTLGLIKSFIYNYLDHLAKTRCKQIYPKVYNE